MKLKKLLVSLVFCFFVFCFMIMGVGCDLMVTTTTTSTSITVGDKINWENEANGTLTIINNTSKDVVIFKGQTPSFSNNLGGVKALTSKIFNIEDDVDDFGVGGYLILRGMNKDEYDKNKNDLNKAKIEFSAMATYGQGKKYRTEINPSWTGEYYARVTNGGKIGIELRLNSPDGEKVAFLPSLAVDYKIYFENSDNRTLFPVYVYYSKINNSVNTIKPTSLFDTVSFGPRPVTDSTVITSRLPADESVTWEQIANSIVFPVAFITCTNNVSNQSTFFKNASLTHKAQNGYDSINSGETLVFEIASTDAGQAKNLNFSFYGGILTIPVKDSNGNTPIIKNSYNYSINLNYKGGNIQQATSYEAIIIDGTKRDISSEILSL